MTLSRTELAASFQVSTNTVTTWRNHGLPCLADGGPGIKAKYDFEEVANFLWNYSNFSWAKWEEPDVVIVRARARARTIVRARSKAR